MEFVEGENILTLDFSMRYQRLHEDAKAPEKAHDNDLGWDLFSVEDPVIPGHNSKLIRTGLAIGFPPNVGGILKDRSGVASKQGLFVHAGVIDPGYIGEIQVLIYNSRNTPIAIAHGSKIAQMILMPVFQITSLKEVDELIETQRGDGGFGSTGA